MSRTPTGESLSAADIYTEPKRAKNSPDTTTDRPASDPIQARREAEMADRLLTVSEVMERLHLSRAKVYDLIRSRALPSGTVGRARRIPASAVNTFMQQLVETEV